MSFQQKCTGLRCVRKGRFESGTVAVAGLCPAPCDARPDCGSCLDQPGSDCVWCEDTAVCFSFAAYTRSLSFLQYAVLVEKTRPFFWENARLFFSWSSFSRAFSENARLFQKLPGLKNIRCIPSINDPSIHCSLFSIYIVERKSKS